MPVGFRNTRTFRLACLFSVGIFVLITTISVLIYWQIAMVILHRSDGALYRNAYLVADENSDDAKHDIERMLDAESRIIVAAGLFDPHGGFIAGNIRELSPNLPIDGLTHPVPAFPDCCGHRTNGNGRFLAQTLADGRILLLARNMDTLDMVGQTIRDSALTELIPAILLALGIGTFLGRRTSNWMNDVQTMTARIEHGEIWQRLPVPIGDDSTRWLVESVNRILDGIGDVIDTTRSTNVQLAHDLLSPLAGVRSRLERATAQSTDFEDLRETVIHAISGLDHTVRLASAFLKLGTIERGHIRQHFQPVRLDHVVMEIGELFSVMAEEKSIALAVQANEMAVVPGDQDLLMEAIANLVDNAIKFTPEGGSVALYVRRDREHFVIGVSDTGPGLPVDQHDKVLDRFYRLDSSPDAAIPGHGLGLSLVDAVVRLHGLTLRLKNASPGLVVEILCAV